jgi:ribonuclease HI
MLDAFPLRSNQRAELCAAKLGIEFLAKAHAEEQKSGTEAWIVATESEYVVKGMTQWLPRKDWRTSKGTKPANLDLFLALESVVTTQEAKNVTVSYFTQMLVASILN